MRCFIYHTIFKKYYENEHNLLKVKILLALEYLKINLVFGFSKTETKTYHNSLAKCISK